MKKKIICVIVCGIVVLANIISTQFGIFEDKPSADVQDTVLSENTSLDVEREPVSTPELSPEPLITPSPEPVVDPSQEEESPAGETAPPEHPQVALHSGIREDGSFDGGTLFIGDSLTFLMITHYLDTYDLIGDAKYTCKAGAGLPVYFGGYRLMYGEEYNCLFPPEWYGMTFPEAAADFGEDATAIYIMLGTNQDPDASPQSYIEIVDYLLEVCPNATVHLQTVPYATAIPYEKVNINILGAYEYYKELGEARVMLIDTCTAIGQNIISDGVHMNDIGRDNWYKALLAHAEENGLPQ